MDIAKIRKKAKEKEEAGKKAPDAEIGAQAPSPEPEAPAASSVEDAPAAPEHIAEPESADESGASDAVEPPSGGGFETDAAHSEGEEPEEILELLTFTLADEEFAFRVSEIEEIVKFQRIARVPTLRTDVLGITSLRGKIIPVLDLKRRLIVNCGGGGAARSEILATAEADRNVKILILSGPKGFIGAMVDKVKGVVRLPEASLVEPPAHLKDEERKYLDGVVVIDRRFISVISAEEALSIEVG